MLVLDHVVVAALSLDEGIRWVEDRLRVPLEPGGQHPGHGTHNALLRIGSDVYLEVLAPDPAQASPECPRLFGLDEPATRRALADGPRVLHWVVRAPQAAAAAAALAASAGVTPEAMGVPTPMRRGDLAWTLTLTPDGSRPPMALPSVIDWGGTPHPCSRLPDREVRLDRFAIAAPAQVRGALAMVAPVGRISIEESGEVAYAAHLATRRGTAVL